ncbi:hypothetical protein KIL84_006729 [Mauremys mutica]|uniref:Uncharacterized protein n=1 Tax=Mauremys mutica TaxID=74926 RepID=A0A9D3X0G1_9SAUR|nr:hypothetical protein KIL84_006729 [Mauremys mutica]
MGRNGANGNERSSKKLQGLSPILQSFYVSSRGDGLPSEGKAKDERGEGLPVFARTRGDQPGLCAGMKYHQACAKYIRSKEGQVKKPYLNGWDISTIISPTQALNLADGCDSQGLATRHAKTSH